MYTLDDYHEALAAQQHWDDAWDRCRFYPAGKSRSGKTVPEWEKTWELVPEKEVSQSAL